MIQIQTLEKDLAVTFYLYIRSDLILIEIFYGDIFSLQNVQAITNPVNCVGIMGKGLAAQFKNKYPKMYRDYYDLCKSGVIQLGRPYLYKRSIPWILNFPTKDHWIDKSDYKSIVSGIDHILAYYKDWDLKSLAIPPLGCGCGGLKWSKVKKILSDKFSNIEDLQVIISIPSQKWERECDLD